MVTLSKREIREAVRQALAEDLGSGDATTLATVPARTKATAVMVAREPLVVAGLAFAVAAFRELGPRIRVRCEVRDGEHLGNGRTLLRVEGPARALLSAERVALNFLQRLSGIATLTAAYVAAVADTRARILDTRKTTPGWRRFEKYAVACGGGQNHRLGLADMILIKDNHLVALRDAAPNAIAAAVERSRAACPHLRVEVEADTLTQVGQAVAARADLVLLDNMRPPLLRKAVAIVAGRCQTEASGGVNLRNVRATAKTGVDFISVGALTHSARAVDIGLDFDPRQPGGDRSMPHECRH